MTLTFAVGMLAAASAHAAYYKTVYCAAANGSGHPTLGARPGFFNFPDLCGTAYSDPPGDGGFLRLEENTTGTAGNTDEASYSWSAPPGTSIAAVSAYTRVPSYFNLGWRSRFWAEGFDGSENNILMQGSGVANEGIYAPATSNFVFHAWPFSSFGDYKRLVFAMTCYRPAGCSREGSNAADANSIAIVLNDKQDAQVNFEGSSALLGGAWVRGNNPVAWRESDQGSGLRFSRLGIDGAVLGDGTIDYQANGGCRTGRSAFNGEFANDFQPCTPGPYLRYYSLESKSLSDGQHQLSICVQDFAQYQHIGGSATETCDRRLVHTDNTAPGKPAALEVTSANPQRYLDRFGAKWSLPPDPGSPIAKVHYEEVDSNGKVVVPEKIVAGTNPTALPSIEGPKASSASTLRVRLEDSVGLIGPAAEAAIPHDTVPPAAPQGLQVAAPDTPRSADGFDLHWHNLTDAGSPIDAAHYQVLGAGGGVIVPTQTLSGENVDRAENIETPRGSGNFDLRLWLTDAEGNVGAPVTAPLSYECARSPVPGGVRLAADLGGQSTQTVDQGQGATLSGSLRDTSAGPLAGAPLCVFSQVEGESGRDFLGLAFTDAAGNYRFAIGAGASRELSVVYRDGHRLLRATARLQTQVHPTLRARKTTIRNGQVAHLEGEIPGPRNDDVVIVLQVKQGKGWLAFRRYRTRDGGHFEADYHFRRTIRPSTYEMRAQVRESGGFPYEEGDSDPLFLRVLSGHGKEAKKCRAAKRLVKRRGRCSARSHSHVAQPRHRRPDTGQPAIQIASSGRQRLTAGGAPQPFRAPIRAARPASGRIEALAHPGRRPSR